MRRSRFATVLPGFPHHVVLRGNNRRRLCSFRPDYARLLEFIARATLRAEVQLHALCLLSNHLHAVVTPVSAAALSSWVRAFAQPYAQERNRRRGGSGKLFEERYFAKPIETEAQLAATFAYVDLNPVEAGVVHDVGDYPWATFPHYAREGESRVPPAAITPHPWHSAFARAGEFNAAEYAAWIRARASERLTERRATCAGVGDGPLRAQDSANRDIRRPNHTRCG